jgi:hypothetical protein
MFLFVGKFAQIVSSAFALLSARTGSGFFGTKFFVGDSGGSGSAAAAETRFFQNSSMHFFLSDHPAQVMLVIFYRNDDISLRSCESK